EGNSPAASEATGIRHVLKASLSVDPSSPYAKPQHGPMQADLHATIQISDHAPGLNFFGLAIALFAYRDPGAPQAEQTVWEARRCHRDRGLPKISVLRIDGIVADGDVKTTIAAAARHIGKLMPADEITVSKPLFRAPGSPPGDIAIQARTKISRWIV